MALSMGTAGGLERTGGGPRVHSRTADPPSSSPHRPDAPVAFVFKHMNSDRVVPLSGPVEAGVEAAPVQIVMQPAGALKQMSRIAFSTHILLFDASSNTLQLGYHAIGPAGFGLARLEGGSETRFPAQVALVIWKGPSLDSARRCTEMLAPMPNPRYPLYPLDPLYPLHL